MDRATQERFHAYDAPFIDIVDTEWGWIPLGCGMSGHADVKGNWFMSFWDSSNEFYWESRGFDMPRKPAESGKAKK